MESQRTDCGDGESQAGALPSAGSVTPSGTVGYHRGRKRRPISVIGGVNFYGSAPAEEIQGLLTQVRYKTLSANCNRPFRFLVSVFSLENRLDASSFSFPFVKLTLCTYYSAFLVTNYFVLLLRKQTSME